MAKNIIPNANYFLVGLVIGSVVGILFAPKSGQETREYIAKKTKDANEYTRQKAREVRDRAEDAIGRGKETIAHAVRISSGGPPIFLIAEEETFTFAQSAAV